MESEHNRRDFLHCCAAFSAGAACGSLPGVSNSALAIEPIARTGTARFKFSVAAYSYRRLLTGENPELTLSDFINDCAAMGVEGTELTSYYFPEPTTPEYVHSLKRHCFRIGLDVSGTAIRNDFGYPPGEARQAEIAHVKKWVDLAEMLGAPVIRIFAGKEKSGVTSAQMHSLMVSGFEECCQYAGQHGVYLALENHGGPTSTAEGMLAFVRDVNSPWFGVNLDTGNFHTDDPYGDLEKIAPYAVNVQIKVVMQGPDKRKAPTQFKRLAKMLRDSSYRGYIVLEYEEEEDPRVECPKYVDQLREAFA